MEGDDLPDIVGLRDAAPSRACDLVVDQLRSLIIGGQLEPGSRLPAERDLALRFQTSRATISQALRILAALGLVEIHHGSGVYASPHPDRLLTHSLELILALDRPSMIRLCEVRGWLEVGWLKQAAAIARAAEIATPVDIEAIRAEAFDRLASERRSVERWLAHDIEFHRAILRATGNMIALSMVSSVLELMASARVREYREAAPPRLVSRRVGGRGRDPRCASPTRSPPTTSRLPARPPGSIRSASRTSSRRSTRGPRPRRDRGPRRGGRAARAEAGRVRPGGRRLASAAPERSPQEEAGVPIGLTNPLAVAQAMYGRRTSRARWKPWITFSSEPSNLRSSCSMITGPSYPIA